MAREKMRGNRRRSLPRLRTFSGLLLFLVLRVSLAQAPQSEAGPNSAETPPHGSLRPPVFRTLALGSIRPAGWLQNQLQIQANGLTGHLDEFWPDVRFSGWTGGEANGIFTGDECLAGKMPSQGTETCAVVEYMYSLETLSSIFGDPAFGDRLERVAFNALPAAFKPDMWARQYVQQANQPVVRTSEERVYTTNGSEANLFGLETNYGCCTANMHQGWPKFVSHLWMRTADDGLAAVAYAPSRLSSRVKDTAVRIDLETDYPFSEFLHFKVTTERPVSFPIRFRIPSWTEKATIRLGDSAPSSVAAGQFHSVVRTWETTTHIVLRLPMPVRVERRYNRAVAVRRGPLVFSLKIGEEWRRLRGEQPHADWEVLPTTPWNYALSIDDQHPEKDLVFRSGPVGENPFSPEGAPVQALVKGRRLSEWKLVKNTAAPPPASPVHSRQPPETLTLIPYGCTALRITEFPVLASRRE